MKERPILFSGSMINAIHERRKTKTRRVIRPQFTRLWGKGVRRGDDAYSIHVDIRTPDGWKWLYCPYGKAGDRLWVRETWRQGPNGIEYRADTDSHGPAAGSADAESVRWWPSIYMPRQYSRITLEIVSIDAERVQDISAEDIEAEGTPINPMDQASYRNDRYQRTQDFIWLWDSINAKRNCGWVVNPWVWVVEFELIEGVL